MSRKREVNLKKEREMEGVDNHLSFPVGVLRRHPEWKYRTEDPSSQASDSTGNQPSTSTCKASSEKEAFFTFLQLSC